ncbi:MAG: DUF1841 family protein [Chromatiales bacterium]|jgi:hypothetical protein|nr:DUF1841 family protein [Chromatiales bacterium]MDX9766273.1 DUF1841 family protein [Ectothiorhodospiraceae bacterium]
MLYGNDRDQLRRFYCDAWRRLREQAPLEPLERQVAELVGEHPEYHRLLEDPDAALGAEFTPESGQGNPFLHMGLHLTIRDQAATDRPAGFTHAYRDLVQRIGAHEAEHAIMECLGRALWEAQHSGQPPDDRAYLECVRSL